MSKLVAHIDTIAQPDWDAFVEQAPSGHLLQTWGWGEFKAQLGWQPIRVAVEQDGRVSAAAQLLLKRSPLASMVYVPKGPVLARSRADVSQKLMETLHQVARQHRVITTKVEPDWPETPKALDWLTRMGFRPSAQTVQPRRTIIVDIRPDEETILQSMKSKTRYNIRLAGRKGVVVRSGDERDVSAFHRLMAITGDRDGFGTHSEEYFTTVWRLFAPRGRANLLVAEYDGQLLAGLMAFALGAKAWYMYGASSNAHRNLMPTYLLQWEAIKWARAKGCRTYDLFGIPDLDESTLEAAIGDQEVLGKNTPQLWGVYRNKRGYGGSHMRYVGAFDYVYRPRLYGLLNAALEWRRQLRG